jgi:glutathione transport system ATP-binding protein
MRQRVMIAMALSCRPSLLIADEPTTALDVTIQAQILQLIRELQAEMHMGVVFITHDMGVVAEVADRVLVMHRAREVETGTSEEVFARPRERYTRALLAAVPRLGAMHGTELPRKFDLLRTDDAPAADEAPPQPQDTVRDEVPPVLRVKDLVTRFDLPSGLFGRVTRRVHAVERVSFDLRLGETLALVGESGCGKSTTGRSLLRLVDSQSGLIEFGGKNVRELPRGTLQGLRRNIQFIFQDPFASLDPRLTVGFTIMEPLLVHGIASGKEAQQRVEWLLRKVGLPPEVAQRYPHEFSGGQRQRIAIARAVVLRPEVLVLDEPTSALDVSVQQQVLALLAELQSHYGMSYVFISHDLAVVRAMSHRVMVMRGGDVIEEGEALALFDAPREPYTKALLAAAHLAA